jgi:hypothetical protein
LADKYKPVLDMSLRGTKQSPRVSHGNSYEIINVVFVFKVLMNSLRSVVFVVPLRNDMWFYFIPAAAGFQPVVIMASAFS